MRPNKSMTFNLLTLVFLKHFKWLNKCISIELKIQIYTHWNNWCFRCSSQLSQIIISAGVLSVQFNRSVVSDSWRPHGLQHARPPCPSPSPRVCLSSCSLHQWCRPASSRSALSLSQHQGLLQRVICSHQMTKILQLQHQAFQSIFRVDLP